MAQSLVSLFGKVKEWGMGMAAHLLNVPFSVFQETKHLLESSTTSPREDLAGARAVLLSRDPNCCCSHLKDSLLTFFMPRQKLLIEHFAYLQLHHLDSCQLKHILVIILLKRTTKTE